jgi:selenocysteine lyase/cysteine desulfurase
VAYGDPDVVMVRGNFRLSDRSVASAPLLLCEVDAQGCLALSSVDGAAKVALDYAADALESPHGSHMRAVTRDLKEARKVVAELLEALEWAVDAADSEEHGARWYVAARAAIRRAKEQDDD